MSSKPFDQYGPLEVADPTRVFILTGAGISAESGLTTFRDAGGLWEQHRFEDVASPEAWARDPALVWRFYSDRREQARGCAPNAAHAALAELEAHVGDRLTLCTQNVDPLHERGGSRHVIHMHGELFKSRCESPACERPPFDDNRAYRSLAEIPRCACGARVRPHIVWFGEVPFEMYAIKRAVEACDLFVVVGSSGSVYPAAGLVREMAYRQQCGERVKSVYVGPEPPDNADCFHECRIGTATQVLPSLFRLRV